MIKTLKNQNRRVISVLLVFCMLLTLVSGSLAYFTDRVDTVVSAKAGSVSIELDYTGINLKDADGKDILNPGDGRNFNYTVTSTGSKSIDVKETIILSAYDKNLQPLALSDTQSEFEIYETKDVTYDATKGWLPNEGASPITVKVLDNNVITYTRPVYVLSGNSELDDDKREIEYNDNGDEIPSIQSNELMLIFKAGSLNTYQAAVLKADLLVEAKQHRNTEAVEWLEVQSSTLTISNGNSLNVVPGAKEFGPQESEDGDWIYKDNGDGTVTIVDTNKVVGDKGTLVIPEKVDGKEVTGIEMGNILNNDNIDEDVTLEFENPEVAKDVEADLIFTYTTDADGVHIVGLTPTGAKLNAVSIPETIKGQPVLDSDYEGILNSSNTAIGTANGKRLQSIFVEGDVIAKEGIDTVFTYSDNGDGTATITGFTTIGRRLAAHINIPEEINGLTVTKLSTTRDAFTDSSMTELTIPSTLTNIVNFKGANVKNLKTINLNADFSSYNSSSASVFAGFPVETVNINTNTTSLNHSLFRNFLSTNLTINTVEPITSIGQYAFAGTHNLTDITLNGEAMMVDGVLTIPSGITTINNCAFLQGYSIKEVTIPNTVTSMGTNVFQNCTSLEKATIDIASVPNETFSGCTKLNSVEMTASVTSLGNMVFRKTDLTEIVIPNTVTKTGYGLFQDCKSLTDVTIGTGITALAADLFMGCTALENVNIPNTVTSIASRAFYNCTSISEITIPASVTSIGGSAFYGWTADQTIYIEGKTAVSEFATSTGLTDNANLTIVFK